MALFFIVAWQGAGYGSMSALLYAWHYACVRSCVHACEHARATSAWCQMKYGCDRARALLRHARMHIQMCICGAPRVYRHVHMHVYRNAL